VAGEDVASVAAEYRLFIRNRCKHPKDLRTCHQLSWLEAKSHDSQRPDLLVEARQLLAVLVAALKDNNVLEQHVIKKQQDTHYPGTFPPWIVSGLERWSRYVVLDLLQLSLGPLT
jgi:hypothetical protein